MNGLFHFAEARRNHSQVDGWFAAQSGELAAIARHWFDVMRACGNDVCEVMHDDQATACVGETAFAYVAIYKAHINVGFFRGAEFADPAGLMTGTGKYMRHVKVRPDKKIDAAGLTQLIQVAYQDMKNRLSA